MGKKILYVKTCEFLKNVQYNTSLPNSLYFKKSVPHEEIRAPALFCPTMILFGDTPQPSFPQALPLPPLHQGTYTPGH